MTIADSPPERVVARSDDDVQRPAISGSSEFSVGR
jgi:hypothetical protein